MSNSTKKRYAQSETMIKQAVQRNAKDLKLLFTRADKDGSGDLDANEVCTASIPHSHARTDGPPACHTHRHARRPE
jgi:hypothetical protein